MIVKSEHKSDFFQMNNKAIQGTSLSWAAKGLLAYLLSLPEKWELHLRYLFCQSLDGRKPTEAAMKELIDAGHVVKEQGENKRRTTRYTVYEDPALCPKRTQKTAAFVSKKNTIFVSETDTY